MTDKKIGTKINLTFRRAKFPTLMNWTQSWVFWLTLTSRCGFRQEVNNALVTLRASWIQFNDQILHSTVSEVLWHGGSVTIPKRTCLWIWLKWVLFLRNHNRLFIKNQVTLWPSLLPWTTMLYRAKWTWVNTLDPRIAFWMVCWWTIFS